MGPCGMNATELLEVSKALGSIGLAPDALLHWEDYMLRGTESTDARRAASGARTLCNPDLESIARARAVIENIVASRYLGVQADPAFAFTDFDQLPAHVQEAERQIAQDNDHGNRIRVAIHMCLSAASVALEVGEALMNGLAELPPAQRAEALLRCGEDALAASDAARHASFVLTGEEVPETDAFFEVTRV